ncbi:MAG: response regulator transcription factor, partial [Bacteroidota bacterium]
MIKALIVDDEKHSVATLAWKLEKFCPEVQVVNSFTDPAAALDFILNNKLDLVFLDIEMPRLNGFELLGELPQPLGFEVIFITAYDEFGIRAIKANALDYLLKPVQIQELKEAIAKFKSKKSTTSPPKQKVIKTPKRIALATKESIEFVFPEDIILCSSESNYTMIYLTGGRKKLISRTLKDVEVWLQNLGFFRVHNSH